MQWDVLSSATSLNALHVKADAAGLMKTVMSAESKCKGKVAIVTEIKKKKKEKRKGWSDHQYVTQIPAKAGASVCADLRPAESFSGTVIRQQH